MVKVSVPAIADVIIDPSSGLGLLEIEVCGLVERIIEGKTTYVAGFVVDPVLKLGFGGFLTELDAVPAEPVLEPVLKPGLGGLPTELDAAAANPVLELGLWGFPTELDAEPTPGGSCPADNGAEYAVSASKQGILGV